MVPEKSKSNRPFSVDIFPNLQNRDQFFERITEVEGSSGRMIKQYLLLNLFAFIYGIVMGSYHSFAQAASSGVKVMCLFSLVLLVCFPAFYVVQKILGSQLRIAQMASVILSGFVLTTSIMVAFAPIVIFFLITGGNYYFLQLLHIIVFLISGAFGMKTVVDALRFSCEKKNVYPHIGVVVFRFWVVIMAFVGIQLAWNLRPFLGDRGEPFELFRDYEGNFYTAVIYSAKKLVEEDLEESRKTTVKRDQPTDQDKVELDTLEFYHGD